MRRFIAAAVLVVFFAQTSGSAVAATASEPAWHLDVRGAFSALRGFWSDTPAYAALTGHLDRYTLMHGTPPIVPARGPDTSLSHRPRAATPGPRFRFRPRTVSFKLRDFEILKRGFHWHAPRNERLSAGPIVRELSISGHALVRAGGRFRAPNSPARSLAPASVTAAAAGTGVKPFWEYSPRAIPGAGVAAVNVATGNLIVAQTDADVHRPGVNLSFTRVYNSRSQHDAAGDDGSEPSLFGNKWTNEYDIHFVYNSAASTVTIFDATGAAWVYTKCNNATGWCPPKGQYAVLATDPNDGCGFAWIQPSGVTYYLHDDNDLGCSTKAGVKGRLYEILGRNINNEISLSVTFDGTGSGGEDIREIDAAHSDGEQLKMIFAPVGANTEMTELDMPNSMGTLSYLYDASGNLIEADRLGNGTTIPASIIPARPQGQPFPTGDLPVQYNYHPGSLLYWAVGPRATIASWQCGECGSPKEGGDVVFVYDSSSRLSSWSANGVLNFIPADSLNVALQGGWGAWAVYDVGAYSYNTGYTTFADTPNHGAKWTFDTTTGAVTGHGPCADKCASSPTYYWTTEERDSNLNVVASIDPNGNETDFKFDGGGDLVERIAPSAPSPSGPFHRTDLYSYDDNHNLLSYCDPFATKALGKNNQTSPGQTPCPLSPGNPGPTVVYAYNTPNPAGTPSPEPYGCLSDIYAANTTSDGYHTTISYGGNCGNGLPTQTQGASITQDANNTTRQPVQSFTYYPNTTAQGAQGELETYSEGYGQWSYTYDGLNRQHSATDPDGVTSYICYNSDGSVSATTTAKQYQMDGVKCGPHSTTYTYDADGDVTNVIHHYGNVARGTQKYYDGFDRLVEVVTPADGNIDVVNNGGNKTYTRYIYDLTANANVSMTGSGPYLAHGNIYKTQECRSQCPSFTDLNGNAFDPMDRVTTRYQYSPTTLDNVGSLIPGSNPGPLRTWTNTYDVTQGIQGELGLLTSTTDPAGTTTSFNYNVLDEVTAESFSDGTPNAAYAYDPDGRVASASNSLGADNYVWNADGSLQADTESGFTNPATMAYSYYADGKRMTLTITDNAVSPHFNQTRQYAYRTDGARSYLSVSGMSNPFTWTYTNAGRLDKQIDPLNGSGPFSSPEFPNGVTIGPKNPNYDANTGLVSSLTMPNGLQETGFTYDAESEPTGFTVNAPGFTFQATTQYPTNSFVNGVTLGYDVLGELYQTQAKSPAAGSYQTVQQEYFEFGHPIECDVHTGIANCGGPPSWAAIDAQTGAEYSYQDVDAANGYTVCNNVSFDKDGRESSNIAIPKPSSAPCNTAAYLREQWSYDALDHTTSLKSCTSCGADSYQWDAMGNLRTYKTGGNPPYTLHWDGDDLVLVTTVTPPSQGSNNVVEEFDVEHLAAQGSNGSSTGPLIVYDRDSSGTVVESHTNLTDSGLTVTPDYFGLGKLAQLGFPNISGAWPNSGSGYGSAASPLVGMPREDGYQVGALTIQGVRAYDTATGQWTTPDDYKGDVDDPKTQRVYQWNGNNPVTNSDPSGYCYADQTDANGDILSSSYHFCWKDNYQFGGVAGNGPAYYPITPYMWRQVQVQNKWLEQPCHANEVGKGAKEMALDALGLIPLGNLPKFIGHVQGLRGAAAVSSGRKLYKGVTTVGGIAVSAKDLPDDPTDGTISTGLAAAGFAPPPIDDIAAGLSLMHDFDKMRRNIKERCDVST